MADWRIKKKTDDCALCERAFEEGEAFFSVLRASADGLVRQDSCPACFEARTAEEQRSDLFFWRTRRQPEGDKRGLAVDFEALEGLFLALEGRQEEKLAELRYLLSLLLMRKRRLKLVRVARRAEREAMVLRRPRRDEALEVAVFDLSGERMAGLRDDLARIFEGAGADELLAEPPPEVAAQAADEDSAAVRADGSQPAERGPDAGTRGEAGNGIAAS